MKTIELKKREHGCYRANANFQGMKVQYFFNIDGVPAHSITGESVTDISDTDYSPSVDTLIKKISEKEYDEFKTLVDFTFKNMRYAECNGFMSRGNLTKKEYKLINDERTRLFHIEDAIFSSYNNKLEKKLKYAAWKFLSDKMLLKTFLKYFAW